MILSRIYAVGNGLALTLTLSPRRGKQVCPRWDESLISERRSALESVSLSPGVSPGGPGGEGRGEGERSFN